MLFNSTLLKKLSYHAKNSLAEAEHIAANYNGKTILPIHLFIAIYLERGSLGSLLLKDAGVTEHSYASFLLKKKRASSSKMHSLQLSKQLKEILTRAYLLASDAQFSYVGTEHLVYAILESTDKDIRNVLASAHTQKKSPSVTLSSKKEFSRKRRSFPPMPNLSQFLESQNVGIGEMPAMEEDTSYLEQFCVDLSSKKQQKKQSVLIGREKEINRLIHILGRKNKNNAILIGEPGVGKTALVSGLAQRIRNGNVPASLFGKRILELDMALVIAGTSFRGEFENRLKEIVQEIQDDPNVILFIDEIHSVVGAGNANGSLDAANILKPALARGDLRCIGATTFAEYKKFIEKDPALERRFQPVTLQEPSPKEASRILKGLLPSYEQFHQVSIMPEAIQASVEMSTRFIPERFLPDKALDVLDEAAAAKQTTSQRPDHLIQKQLLEKELEELLKKKEALIQSERYEEASLLRKDEETLIRDIKKLRAKKIQAKDFPQLSSHDIAQTIARTSGIPVDTIQKTAHAQVQNLYKNISRDIIGQDALLQKLVSSLTRSYMGLSHENRPLGSFLLMGPTGVGKTCTAKSLATHLFQSPQSLIQIHMSELRERHSIASLVGAPAGYVGYGEGGKFTEKVRRQPYSVVLFDEIEKAHPDVLNILLQILEDGELTDAEGRKISFTNTIIVLTTNIGSREVIESQNNFGFSQKNTAHLPSPEALESKLKKELNISLRPEILGRLDEVLVYQPLQKKDIRKIVQKELQKTKRKLKSKSVSLTVPASVIDHIVTKSMEGFHGARLVRKNIHELVENLVAQKLLHTKETSPKYSTEIREGSIFVK